MFGRLGLAANVIWHFAALIVDGSSLRVHVFSRHVLSDPEDLVPDLDAGKL